MIEYLRPFFLSQIVEKGVISAPVPAVEGMHIIFDFSEILLLFDLSIASLDDPILLAIINESIFAVSITLPPPKAM